MLDCSRILVVDDDPIIHLAIRREFTLRGAQTQLHGCHDGLAALDYLDRCPSDDLPQMIVMDVMMPRMGGIECLAEMRRNRRLRSLPVVLVSSMRRGVHVELARPLGAVTFLEKSDDPWTVEDISRAYLEFATPAPKRLFA